MVANLRQTYGFCGCKYAFRFTDPIQQNALNITKLQHVYYLFLFDSFTSSYYKNLTNKLAFDPCLI